MVKGCFGFLDVFSVFGVEELWGLFGGFVHVELTNRLEEATHVRLAVDNGKTPSCGRCGEGCQILKHRIKSIKAVVIVPV